MAWHTARDVFMQGADYFGSICIFCSEGDEEKLAERRRTISTFLEGVSAQLKGYELHKIFWIRTGEEAGRLVEMKLIEDFGEGRTLFLAVGKTAGDKPDSIVIPNSMGLDAMKKDEALNTWLMTHLPKAEKPGDEVGFPLSEASLEPPEPPKKPEGA